MNPINALRDSLSVANGLAETVFAKSVFAKTGIAEKRLSFSVILLAASIGLHAQAASTSEVGFPAPTAKTLARDADYRTRLTPFLTADSATTRYVAAQAQTWLNYAGHESSEASPTDAHHFAMLEVERLLKALEQGSALSMVTPVPPTSGVMRRDLWATAELLKKHPGFSCAANQVAEGEVTLVWAAAEYCELGWRHAREHFSSAQRLLDSARQQAESCSDLTAPVPAWPTDIQYPSFVELNGSEKGCQGVKGPWPLAVPDFSSSAPTQPATEPSIPLSPAAQAEVLAIPRNVHFALDKYELSPESMNVLGEITQALKKYPQISATLIGYTDPRASVAYNQRLSDRRARSVENYLVQQGVDRNRLAKMGKGEAEQISRGDFVTSTALSRRVEIVFVADGLEIHATEQEQDLQREK